jgi:sirohydrochlorin cobaltochelatase
MLKSDLVAICLTVCISLGVCNMSSAAHHHKENEAKKGILLVTFGTSYPDARKAYEKVEEQVRKEFPETPVRWAYTASFIRRKLAKQGVEIDSPAVALAKMKDDGFTHVAVQSLHVINGSEFHDLAREVARWRTNGFEQIELGSALLTSTHDLEHVCEAMLKSVPKERKADEPVVFMGHGTHHGAGKAYLAAAYVLQQLDDKATLASVEEAPSFDNALKMIEKTGAEKVWLVPFMSVAGDHVQNDMASDEPDSWKSILAEKGVKSECLIRGMIKVDAVTNVWIDHLKETWKALK